MELSDRLELYCNMLLSCYDLYIWKYDSQLSLMQSNCPYAAIIQPLFAPGEGKRQLMEYASDHRKPIVMTNQMNMGWIAVPGWSNELHHIYVLGPFFMDAMSGEDIVKGLKAMHLSEEIVKNTAAFLAGLPVLTITRALEYTVMLYYCIYEERISVSDLHYQESEPQSPKGSREKPMESTHGTYALEQQMVQMVREGNLNYKKHMHRIAITGNIGQLTKSGTPIRQMKNAVLACTVLFSRAAIEGGLSPELSMTLSDHYFQSIEACTGLSELSEIAHTMQDDFVARVHKCRVQKLSAPVRKCCDYIDIHLEESFTLKDMAEKLNYSDIYLCRKFKQEIGQGFREYVRQRKLERAKDMLADSSMAIKDISDRLGFCSTSYFDKSFKDIYGVTPGEWREKSST